MSLPSFDQVAQLPVAAKGVVLPEHIDANGHMNIRHYVEYDSLGTFALVEGVGVDDKYRHERGQGIFTAEHHLRYHRELCEGDSFTVHVRVLERGERAIHLMAFLLDRDRLRLANTLEVLAVHVNLGTRRAVPMPADIAAGFDLHVRFSQSLGWLSPTCGAMGIRASDTTKSVAAS